MVLSTTHEIQKKQDNLTRKHIKKQGWKLGRAERYNKTVIEKLLWMLEKKMK